MAKIKSSGVGRPSYQVKWPYNKFTFNQLLEHNGVNLKTGKGKNCSRLTLFKHLQAATTGTKSVIVKMEGTREPNSKKGLGRKAYVFMRRDKFNALKSASTSKVSVKVSARKVSTKVNANASADYEAMKTALATPTPAAAPTPEPVIPTPAPVATAPVIVEPAPAPVAETVEAVANTIATTEPAPQLAAA